MDKKKRKSEAEKLRNKEKKIEINASKGVKLTNMLAIVATAAAAPLTAVSANLCSQRNLLLLAWATTSTMKDSLASLHWQYVDFYIKIAFIFYFKVTEICTVV